MHFIVPFFIMYAECVTKCLEFIFFEQKSSQLSKLAHIIFIIGQLWTFNDSILKNTANEWISADEWNFKPKGSLIYIENTSKSKVLEADCDGKVTEEDFIEDNPRQLWKKGIANNDGGFTLIPNINSSQLLTAVSSNSLEVKGK